MPTAQARPSSIQRILLLALILMAYGRLLWQLDAKNLWWDETLSLQRAQEDWLSLVLGYLPMTDGSTEILTIDQHPFTYFAAAKVLVQFAGDNEIVVRYPSVIASTVLVAVAWAFARWFVRRGIFLPAAPYWAALLAAISPYFLWFGQEARPYALWGMLALLSTYLLMRATEGGPAWRRWAVGFLAVEILFLASHYFAVFLVPVHALLSYVWLARRNRIAASTLAALLLAAGAGISVILYWFYIVRQGGGSNFARVSLSILFPDLLNAFSLGLSVDLAEVWWIDVLFGLTALLGILWALRSRESLAAGGWLPVAMVLVPIAVLLTINLFMAAYMTARHMALIGGAFVVLVGAGLAVAGRRWGWLSPALAAILVVPTLYSTANYFSVDIYGKDDFRRASGYLEDRLADGDAVLVKSPFAWFAAQHYFPLDAMDRAAAAGAHVAHRGVPLLVAPWEATVALLEQMKQEHRRIWLVRIGPHLAPDEEGRIEEWLDANMFLLRDQKFFSQSTLHVSLYLPAIPVADGAPAGIEHPGDATFGDQIRLVGYDVGEPYAELGLPITLYWQTLSPTDKHYKYILKLVETGEDGQERVLSLTEREPYDAAIPTIYWQPGQTILEYTELPAAAWPELWTDRHQIVLQVYQADTLEKLNVTQAEGAPVAADGQSLVLPYTPAVQK